MVHDLTKTRLLEAAGEEFADKGFEGATVRVICDRAGVNLAAVNYHFGDKEHLYVQALLHAHRCGSDDADPETVCGLAAGDRGPGPPHPSRTSSDNVVCASKSRDLASDLDASGDDEADPRRRRFWSTRRSGPEFERLAGDHSAQLCPDADDPANPCFDLQRGRAVPPLSGCRGRSPSGSSAPEAFERARPGLIVADHITRFTLAALGVAAADWRVRDRSTSRPSSASRKGGRRDELDCVEDVGRGQAPSSLGIVMGLTFASLLDRPAGVDLLRPDAPDRRPGHRHDGRRPLGDGPQRPPGRRRQADDREQPVPGPGGRGGPLGRPVLQGERPGQDRQQTGHPQAGDRIGDPARPRRLVDGRGPAGRSSKGSLATSASRTR